MSAGSGPNAHFRGIDGEGQDAGLSKSARRQLGGIEFGVATENLEMFGKERKIVGGHSKGSGRRPADMASKNSPGVML